MNLSEKTILSYEADEPDELFWNKLTNQFPLNISKNTHEIFDTSDLPKYLSLLSYPPAIGLESLYLSEISLIGEKNNEDIDSSEADSSVEANTYEYGLLNNKQKMINIKKSCPKCGHVFFARPKVFKCRRCNHCINCRNNLKKGGGRHHLCTLCGIRCFDARDGRTACQKCKPSRFKRQKRNKMQTSLHY